MKTDDDVKRQAAAGPAHRLSRRGQDHHAEPRARAPAAPARRRDHQRARAHRHRHAPDQEPRRRRDGAGGRLRLPRGARPGRAVGRDRRGQPPFAPRRRVAGDDRHRRAVVDSFRAGGSRRRGAGGRRRRRVRRRRRGGRRPARPSRGGARAGRGRRPDPADQAGSRAAPTRSSRCTGSWRGATRPPSAPASPTATRARPRWCRGCSTCGARRARRGPTRHAHAHGQLAVVAFTDPEPLLAEPLLAVIDGLGDGAGAREGLRPPGGRRPARLPRARGRAHRPRDSASRGAASRRAPSWC